MHRAHRRLSLHRHLFLVAIVALCAALLAPSLAAAADKDVPRLYFGYVFTTHHTPIMAAMAKGEAFKDSGAWLKPMVDRQKYELMNAAGEPIAIINMIVSKSGSETTTLFAQGRMDLAMSSSTAFMSGIDRGTAMKMLCPLHVDGMSLVFPKDSTLSGWAQVEDYIKKSPNPVKLGYHSPTSAPRIVFEGALHKAGLKLTEDANNADADVLLVDLKSPSNLIPALLSGQVDCWVGPAPHPSIAEFKGVGHIALDSRELPPEGHWHDFPCCVLGSSDAVIADHPEVAQAMTDLLTTVCKWCNENKKEAAEITAQWIGAPAEALEKSSIIYTTNPTANWMRGEATFVDMLNDMNKLKGPLKGKKLEEVEPIIYDFSFVKKSLGKI